MSLLDRASPDSLAGKIRDGVALTDEEWERIPLAWEPFAVRQTKNMIDPKHPKTPGVNYQKDKSGYQPPPELLEIDPTKLRAPAKITERKVPTVFRDLVKVEWFREFTFWERIKILFGCNLVTMTGIATQHKVGEMQPMIIGLVSYQKNASDHMKNVVGNMIEEQHPKTPQAQEAAFNREQDGQTKV